MVYYGQNIYKVAELIQRFLTHIDFNASWFMDSIYEFCDLELLQKVTAEWDKFLRDEKLQYLTESFDCEDFAFMFKAFATNIFRKHREYHFGGSPFGIAIGRLYKDGEFLSYHAWNFILYYIEIGKGQVIPMIIEFDPQPVDIHLIFNHQSFDGFYYECLWVLL